MLRQVLIVLGLASLLSVTACKESKKNNSEQKQTPEMQVPPPMPQPLPEIPHENPEHANPSPEGQGPTGGPGYGTKSMLLFQGYIV